MILADTTVWVHHFRQQQEILTHWLSRRAIIIHPFVCGELACGSLKNRRSTLSYLLTLPSAEIASNEEVMALVEEKKLWSRGFGWVDAHLLASALLSNCRLWTMDKSLLHVATELGVNLRLQ